MLDIACATVQPFVCWSAPPLGKLSRSY